jgi:hypothetical protein
MKKMLITVQKLETIGGKDEPNGLHFIKTIEDILRKITTVLYIN